MTTRRIDRVRKRDGQVVAYDERKLAEAIFRAARTAGRENRWLADDLAGVVTTYLERHHDREVPSSAEIRRMVERILFETGHAEVARAYLLHGESKRREAAPAAPEEPAGELFPTEPVLVEGAARGEVSTWGRERISAALVKEAGLDPESAGEIAAAVERRVFRGGERRVATSLIRELVNQELLARGHGSKMRRQLVVGLPKYDLDRLVRPGADAEAPADPDRLCRTIGETTLKQYALQELLPREVADAHLEGRIHLHDLDYPLKHHWLAVPASAILRDGARTGPAAYAEAPVDARDLGAHLAAWSAAASRHVAGGLELDGVETAFGTLLAGREEEAPREARALLLALAGLDRPATWLGIDPLARRSAPAARKPARAFARHLLGAAADLPSPLVVQAGPEVFADEDGLALLREACRLAAARGGVRFLLDRPGLPGRRVSRHSVRGPAESGDEFRIAHAATINLPQACARSEAGTDFYAELETALAAAVRAHLVKRGLGRATKGDAAEYAIGVCGLDEAVRLLCGSAMAEDEGALRVGIRVLSFLYFRVREEAEKQGLRLALHDLEDDGASGRFLRIDRQMFPRIRGLEAASGPRAAYSPGVHLGGAAALDRESRFHTLLTQAAVRVPRGSLAAPELLALLRHAGTGTLCSQVAVP